MRSEKATTRQNHRPIRAALGVFAVLCVAVTATACKPSKEAEAESDISVPEPNLGSCRLNMPSNTVTIVYDTYGGSRQSNYRLLEHPATHLGRQPITVPKRDGPVLVVVAAYAPTEWDLKIEPGASIVGVIAMGYEPQIVSNVPAVVDVGFSSHGGGVGEGCPTQLHWSSGAGDLKTQISPFLLKYGRRVDEYYSPEARKCDLIDCGEKASGPWMRTSGPAPAATQPGLVRTSAALISAGEAQRVLKNRQ
jgi:hypothetical protein